MLVFPGIFYCFNFKSSVIQIFHFESFEFCKGAKICYTMQLTCASILQHCCSSETGGFPRLVASCTLNNCSFCVEFSRIACNMATEANQLDRESALNNPPHSN